MKKQININNELIKKLRKRTNISIIKCKEALIQAKGDFELAIDNIRKFGLKIAEKKSGCTTLSGLIMTKISSNQQCGVMIEINCETDFVAKENIFKEFANTILVAALNENIDNIDELNLKFKTQRINLISKVRENINIRRFSMLTGIVVGCYTHMSKIGVMVSINNPKITTELIKNIAMHIIAKNPLFININDIPKNVIMRERRVQKDIIRNSGKSQNIAEKIIEGRMNKFFSEIVLTEQYFILDINKTVGDLLNENHLQVQNFIRFAIGDDKK